MSRLLKGLLRLITKIALVGGPIVAALLLVSGLTGFGDRAGLSAASGWMGATLALYVLFWSVLVGGVLRLLLSIDDRLERLEGNR